MRALQQGQKVARQQSEIAWGGPVLSHSAERDVDVVDRSGLQS
jgi:hypothetical protein